MILILMLVISGCCLKRKAPESGLPTTTVAQAPEVQETSSPAEPVVAENVLEAQAKKAGALQSIYFDFDKYQLRPNAKEKLDRTAKWLSENRTVKIRIAGHCDERGTDEYNMALGDRRANSAKNYLVNMGIPSDNLSTISYGEETPADPGHDEAAWAKNRRDEFRITE